VDILILIACQKTFSIGQFIEFYRAVYFYFDVLKIKTMGFIEFYRAE